MLNNYIEFLLVTFYNYYYVHILYKIFYYAWIYISMQAVIVCVYIE